MFKNPVLYAAIIIIWLVAVPSSLIISSMLELLMLCPLLCQHLLVYLFSILWKPLIVAQCVQWSPDCEMWNHIINMHIWRCWHQSFWNWGLLPSSAEVSGFFKFELHSKGTVLCFWSSLRCIKILISIYCRGFKFPYRAVFLLPLDSIILYKATGDSEQDLQRYWPPECCIYQWSDKPTGYGCLYKKCGLWQQQRSDITVSRTLAKHSNIKSDNTRLRLHYSHHWPESPLTWQIAICILCSFSGLQCIVSRCPSSTLHWVSFLQTSYLSVSRLF